MLKKRHKSYIIKNGIINIMVLTAVFFIAGTTTGAAESEDEFEIKPLYIFEDKAGRDPFEPRHRKEAVPAMMSVDITTFSLQGITESRGMLAALFKSKSGNPFGYIFMDGKLYGENDRVIPDIAGEIKANNEVLLIQGDREVLFKLDENTDGPNIRPDTKIGGTGK
jgi:hypothetical protein